MNIPGADLFLCLSFQIVASTWLVTLELTVALDCRVELRKSFSLAVMHCKLRCKFALFYFMTSLY